MMEKQQCSKDKQSVPALDLQHDIPFPDEIEHLAMINAKLDDALQKADESVTRLDKEYRDAKQYMVEYRGEIDPREMFQNELLLKQTDRTGAFAVEIRDRITKLKESPYFARIDFHEKDSQAPAKHYIGRFSFHHENELLIFDWRAPIASMFYDYEIGPAGYEAPTGRIEGEITKKRQFKIKHGVMEYALESSVHVQDDILQRELSHTSDEKMKSIIATIQQEQNQIIRNEKANTLIIQGVAGSGKTSIALHRIAFLLYRFKNQLNAKHVTILSPNKVFGDYIANVLPELGEEPIYQLSFADIAEIQLERVIGFESDRDPLLEQDEKWRQRVRFKSTLAFVERMDEYLQQVSSRVFMPTDYTFGRFSVKSIWIQERFQAYKQYPIKQRLAMVADDMHDHLKTQNIMQEEIPGARVMLKSLTSMLTMKNSLALYKDFYKTMGALEMFVMPQKKTLEWADVYPFLYLHAAFEGLRRSSLTRHLVIDEMQDYTPIQYAVLNLLFQCPKTIVGDFGQLINPNHLHTLEDIQQVYQGAEFVKLNKSYRSTYEIMTFAKGIQHMASLEPVKRHGNEPLCIFCADEHEEILQIKKAICDFEARGNASLGIILKTNNAAKTLYDMLSQECEVNLISPASASFKNGVSITSIQMSKGLEFDEVIVPQANSDTYRTEYDRSLLYIACTRAMHRLTLMYTGDMSRFITQRNGNTENAC